MGLAGFDVYFFGTSILGCTWGTKGWYPKGHAHVSSPRVLGGVEDSSKDSRSLLVHSPAEVIDALLVSKSVERSYHDCIEISKYNKLMNSRRDID